MRVRAPTVVSFSTSDPRPTTTPSPSSQRSRPQAWSPTTTPEPAALLADPAPGAEPGPGEHDRAGEDRAPVADDERRKLLALRGRPAAERRVGGGHGVGAGAP